VKTSLPDANVWLALAVEGHIHHVIARSWFLSQPDSSVLLCRITQMALLRLLSNTVVMAGAPRSVKQAWVVASQLSNDRRVVYAADPPNLEPVWKDLTTRAGVGASAWTDAYLAAFAPGHSCAMVTFDRALSRWPEVDLTLLSSAGTSI
jgi:toxin-antitoxin system PIN domain toxin